MKAFFTFKNADAIYYARRNLVAEGATEEELDCFDELVAEYFEYGEYAHIQMDLETGEATLCRVSH